MAGSKTAFGSLDTMISEADHNLEACVELDANFDAEASLQSAKYIPETFISLGLVAT